MRTSTRQAEMPVATSRREQTYVCRFGTGRLLTSGDVPLEVRLPDAGAEELAVADAPSRWARLLERYFAGEAVSFDLDVDAYAEAVGLTAFERATYAALAQIPRGSVVSYGDLATAAGSPRAYRAVGSAMARNRLPVILPCHRVIRSDGDLGQYGDDPVWKERLLTLEGVRLKGGRLA